MITSKKAYYRTYWRYIHKSEIIRWIFDAAFIDKDDAMYWIRIQQNTNPPELQESWRIMYKGKIIEEFE